MPAEDNKALVRRFLAAMWEQGHPAALEEFLASHYQRHLTPSTAPLPLDGFTQRLARFRMAFPDMHVTMEDIFAEGDRVAFRLTIRGTHVRAGRETGFPFLVHPHMLRHATGSTLPNDGQDTRAIEHNLGHKNRQHTVRYTALSAKRFVHC